MLLRWVFCLPQEMSDYLLNRVQVPWMHDLMVSCQEMSTFSTYGACQTNIQTNIPQWWIALPRLHLHQSLQLRTSLCKLTMAARC